ncbi:hypothetical protein NDU88_009479 [Pleurodeles waltl]|uniref:Uncharacterized protein n=1 Tax=Pleurodeles waltl TaxID=8319 RepID=A0AAV7QSV7_PLEWA|nr:hypothetical protein NDU88_009479 [Pleurodeles waltl]
MGRGRPSSGTQPQLRESDPLRKSRLPVARPPSRVRAAAAPTRQHGPPGSASLPAHPPSLLSTRGALCLTRVPSKLSFSPKALRSSNSSCPPCLLA